MTLTARQPASSLPEQAALLTAALSDDPEAQRRLVRLLTPVIHARAASFLAHRRDRGFRANRADVEDLVQEVWSSLLKDGQASLRRWHPDGGASLLTFVGLCAERTIISHYRGGARLGLLEQGAETSELELRAGGRDSIEERAVQADLLVRVLARLREQLSERGRQALQLLYVEELSVAEAERAGGMTKGALYTWRREIKRLAREILTDLGKPAAAAERPRPGGPR